MSKEVESPDYRYGKWKGDPRGVKQDPHRCVEECFSSNPRAGFITYQCRSKRGAGNNGLYCTRHSYDTRNIKPLSDTRGGSR